MFGVVGDDITGCVDIGLMFKKSHVDSDVFMKNQHLVLREGIGAIIADTDSRFIEQEVAYQRVYEKTMELKELGVSTYYKKTCSVFRGNIGAELDAMLDALQADCMIVVVGFPETGRTTVHSTHYVDGILLHKSQFRFDPMNPMLHSNLKEIIQEQSSKLVGSIWWEDLDKGVAYVRERIKHLKNEVSFICIDVRDRHDLSIIAKAASEISVFGGSSALALELASLCPSTMQNHLEDKLPKSKKGILCCCGSVTIQSAQQIAYLKRVDNCKILELDPIDVLHNKSIPAEVLKGCELEVNKGNHILLYTKGTGDRSVIATYQRMANEQGITTEQFGNMIADYMAKFMYLLYCMTKQEKLIFAGGDTSFHCCKEFQVKELLIQDEVEPGIPLCKALGEKTLFLILKSGSFGTEKFFETAIQYLQQE